jgi:hypothetical protein
MNKMKWRIGMALVLILTILNTASAATIELVGQCDTSGYARDVVVVNNHAYIADDIGGLCIVDISDPSDPMIEGIFASGESINSVTIRDKYAYVTAEEGFFIFDISKPSNPIKIGENCSIRAYNVVVSGNYAYLASYSGLDVVDITNPSNPTKVGECTTDSAGSVFVLGNYAYVTNFYNGLFIIDISNPSNPIKVGQYTEGEFFRSVVLSDYYAYVATTGSSGLCVLDVSDKSNPIRIIQYPELSYDLVVSGDYAYIITGHDLCIVDMTQSPPVEIGKYFTRCSYALDLSGNYAYVACYDKGLYIFKIDIVPDTTPPTITINQPSEGQVFTKDIITVSGSASDECGIHSVTVNGEYAGMTSWSKSITLAPGTNTVTIKVIDNEGNTKTIHQTVTYLSIGSIFVSSEPSGANIYLDGAYNGVTPKTISDVSVGYHTIELNKESYLSWSTSVYVTSGDTEAILASMSVISAATPAIIPTVSPTPISTPAFTSTPTPTAAIVDSDGDGVPDNYDYAPYDPNIQSRSDTKAPAFEAVVVIAGLLTVAYLFRRRR